MPVKPIPEGYHAITPYLFMQDAAGLLQFVKKAFDAKEVSMSTAPDGTILHGELSIGDSRLMLTEATSLYPSMPSSFYLYVPDTDATYNKALDAGGVSIMEPADQFYGDRNAGVKDPNGNLWWISTHVEDVSREEMKKREEEYKNKQR